MFAPHHTAVTVRQWRPCRGKRPLPVKQVGVYVLTQADTHTQRGRGHRSVVDQLALCMTATRALAHRCWSHSDPETELRAGRIFLLLLNILESKKKSSYFTKRGPE